MTEHDGIINEIKGLIEADDLAAGLQMLLDLLNGQRQQLNSQDIIVVRVQMGQLRRLRRDETRGDASREDIERRFASLAGRILSHVSVIEPQLKKLDLPREVKANAPASPIAQPSREPVEELVGGYLKSLSWIEHGLQLAKAVCKVQGPTNVGSGFLLKGSTLVTNNHVLPTADVARRAKAIFNFEEDMNGSLRPTSSYELDGDTFATDADLDCTMVKIKDNNSAPPVSHWGQFAINNSGAIRPNDPVTIIQHPLGAPKQIGILGNSVAQIETPYLYYTTDTMRGSSGSPVLDSNWNVVALHRAAGKWSKQENRYLNNQGILISRIAESRHFGVLKD